MVECYYHKLISNVVTKHREKLQSVNYQLKTEITYHRSHCLDPIKDFV